MRNPRRDYTCCTIVAVDLTGLHDPLCGLPRYRAVDVRTWHGTPPTALFQQLRAYLEPWAPCWIVADATGVGQGLVAFLGSRAAFGTRVVPFVFSPVSKARLGSAFVAVVETGRFSYWADDDADAREFFREAEQCAYHIPEGEGAFDTRLRWGVPVGTSVVDDDGRRRPVHDDRLISAALCAVLDDQPWTTRHAGAPTTGRTVREILDSTGF